MANIQIKSSWFPVLIPSQKIIFKYTEGELSVSRGKMVNKFLINNVSRVIVSPVRFTFLYSVFDLSIITNAGEKIAILNLTPFGYRRITEIISNTNKTYTKEILNERAGVIMEGWFRVGSFPYPPIFPGKRYYPSGTTAVVIFICGMLVVYAIAFLLRYT